MSDLFFGLVALAGFALILLGLFMRPEQEKEQAPGGEEHTRSVGSSLLENLPAGLDFNAHRSPETPAGRGNRIHDEDTGGFPKMQDSMTRPRRRVADYFEDLKRIFREGRRGRLCGISDAGPHEGGSEAASSPPGEPPRGGDSPPMFAEARGLTERKTGAGTAADKPPVCRVGKPALEERRATYRENRTALDLWVEDQLEGPAQTGKKPPRRRTSDEDS